MKSLFITIILITSNNTSISKINSNYLSNERTLIQSISSSNTSYSYEQVTDVYKIGYKSFDIPNAYHSDRDYFTFMKISFPRYSNFQNGKLTLIKKSGNIERLETNIYYSNLDYSSTNYQSDGSLSLSYSSSSTFEIDITPAINGSYNRGQNYFYIRLGRSYSSGYGEFYTNSDSSNYPRIELNYSDTPNANSNGNATGYQPISNSNLEDRDELIHLNCFAYAVEVDYSETSGGILQLPNNGYGQSYSQETLLEVSNNVIKECLNHNIILRQIDSYDSSIFSNERRIAFKLIYNQNTGLITGYHFLKQHSNGYWSDKYPDDNTVLRNTINPDTISLPNETFSPAIYFALSK